MPCQKKTFPAIREGFHMISPAVIQAPAYLPGLTSPRRRTLIRIMPRLRMCRMLFIFVILYLSKTPLISEKGFFVIYFFITNPSQFVSTRMQIIRRPLRRLVFIKIIFCFSGQR